MNHIRIASRERFPELTLLWEASVRATHDFLSERDIDVLRPKIRHEYLPALAVYAYCTESNEIVGFIALADAKVEMLFVAPEVRGQGVGKALLRYAMTNLSADSLDVNEQNPHAVGFYRHMGFVVKGRAEKDGLGKPFPLLRMSLPEKIR